MRRATSAMFVSALVTTIVHTMVIVNVNARWTVILRDRGTEVMYKFQNPHSYPIYFWVTIMYAIRVALLAYISANHIKRKRFRAFVLVNFIIAGFGIAVSVDGYYLFEQYMIKDCIIQTYLFIYNVLWQVI